MKTFFAFYTALALASSTAAACPAEPPPPPNAEACLTSRLTTVRDAVTFLEARSAIIRRSPALDPYVLQTLQGLDERLAELNKKIAESLVEPTSEVELRTALAQVATRIALVRSTVSRINIALVLSTDESAKLAAREMSEHMSELVTAIPPDDPARGCPPPRPR